MTFRWRDTTDARAEVEASSRPGPQPSAQVVSLGTGAEPEPARAIYVRDGQGRLPAVALVDAADYERLSCFAWHTNHKGYAIRSGPRANGKRPTIRMHRDVLGIPPAPSLQADHINRDRLDNRRANLRWVTPKGNAENRLYTGKTHCKHGHEFTPENTRLRADGYRYCRTCQSAFEKARTPRLKTPAPDGEPGKTEMVACVNSCDDPSGAGTPA